MRRILILIAIAILFMSIPALAGTIPVVGNIRGPNGSRFTGTIRMTLNYPATDTCSGNILAPNTISFGAANGAILPGATITPNDCLAPSNTFYVTQFYTSQGQLVRQNNFAVVAVGGVPLTQFDLGTAVPTTLTSSNISFVSLANINSVLNNIRLCAGFPGANAGAKIAACIANLPTTGGTADARGLEGAQAITADFFSGVTKTGTLLLGAAQYTTTTCLNVPTGWTIAGDPAGSITASGSIPCILGGSNQDHTGILIRDITLKGAGTATYGIDLSNTQVGADCWNRVVNVDVENVAGAGIQFKNCGGSSTFIRHSIIRELPAGALAITWSNTGGNTTIETVSTSPHTLSDRSGGILASGQIVNISNSQFFGFVAADQTPTLNLIGNYIYPIPASPPAGWNAAAGSVTVTPKSGSNIGTVTWIGGQCNLLTATSDHCMAGTFGSMNLTGMVAVNAGGTSNFFGTLSAIGGTRMIINANDDDLIAGGTQVGWNPPASTVATTYNHGVTQTGVRQDHVTGPFSVGAEPSNATTSDLEVHTAGPDAFLLLDNTNASPSQWILDAQNGSTVALVNELAATGTINLDPGSTGTGATNVSHGNFSVVAGNASVAGTVQTSPVVFSSLPTCTGGTEGSMRAVSDSNTVTWGATITGGMTAHVMAYCDGTNWTVMGK